MQEHEPPLTELWDYAVACLAGDGVPATHPDGQPVRATALGPADPLDAELAALFAPAPLMAAAEHLGGYAYWREQWMRTGDPAALAAMADCPLPATNPDPGPQPPDVWMTTEPVGGPGRELRTWLTVLFGVGLAVCLLVVIFPVTAASITGLVLMACWAVAMVPAAMAMHRWQRVADVRRFPVLYDPAYYPSLYGTERREWTDSGLCVMAAFVWPVTLPLVRWWCAPVPASPDRQEATRA